MRAATAAFVVFALAAAVMGEKSQMKPVRVVHDILPIEVEAQMPHWMISNRNFDDEASMLETEVPQFKRTFTLPLFETFCFSSERDRTFKDIKCTCLLVLMDLAHTLKTQTHAHTQTDETQTDTNAHIF